MPYTGHENHDITLEEAAKLTKLYRESVSSGTVIASYFGRDAIERILDQPSCVGIRIYYGKAENGTPKLVLTGVESSGDDLYDGELAEFSTDCPPNCASSNPLNS